MSTATREAPRPLQSGPRQIPEIAQAFVRHAPALQERLNRSLPIAPKVTRTWRRNHGRPVVDITIHTDPQADQLAQDQRRAFFVARELLIQLGFVVLPTGPTSFRLMGYHGSPIAAPQEQAMLEASALRVSLDLLGIVLAGAGIGIANDNDSGAKADGSR